MPDSHHTSQLRNVFISKNIFHKSHALLDIEFIMALTGHDSSWFLASAENRFQIKLFVELYCFMYKCDWTLMFNYTYIKIMPITEYTSATKLMLIISHCCL